MTDGGGVYGYGTIFSIPVTGGAPATLLSFNGTDGAGPEGSLTLSADGSTLYGTTYDGRVNGQGNVFSIPVAGGTPTTLLSFDGTNGANPDGDLTLSGSTLYGMTEEGGPNGDGNIFSVPVTGGTPTTLVNFDGTNGANPDGSLTLSGSTLYGMTGGGGANSDGTVFALNTFVVTPSGSTNTFAVGGSPVAVDSGVTVTSASTDLAGATVTINNLQSGDSLDFTNQNGISGVYSAGVLTLSGSATPAQYQAALQSVTFSTTSTNTTTRSLSIVALDNLLNSTSASEQVDVSGPDLEITTTDNWGGSSVTSATGTVNPGSQIAYTVVATNAGTSDVTGATIADPLPDALTGTTYTATATGGATGFTSSGSGSIDDVAVDMPAGSTVTYTVVATVDPAATGTLSNTATVSQTFGVPINASLITGLSGPRDVAVSGDDLFVANYTSGTIGQYTTSGTVVNASLVTGLDSPLGIAISGGDLFVTNNNGISEYTTSGTLVNASLVTGLDEPFGIAVSGGDLFVTSTRDGTIGEYTILGTPINASLVTGLTDPEGIAVSGGDLFVASPEGGAIGEYTTSGAVVNASLIVNNNFPIAIAASGGDLFVTSGLGLVGEYTTSGATVNASLVTGLDEPYGITDSGADLFVTNYAGGILGAGTVGEYTTSDISATATDNDNVAIAALAVYHVTVPFTSNGSGAGGEAAFGDNGTETAAQLGSPYNNNTGTGAVTTSNTATSTSPWTFGTLDSGPYGFTNHTPYSFSAYVDPNSFDNFLTGATTAPWSPGYPGGAGDGAAGEFPGVAGYFGGAIGRSGVSYSYGNSGLNGDGSGNPVPDYADQFVDVPTGTLEMSPGYGPSVSKFTAPATGTYTLTATLTDPYFDPFDGPGGANYAGDHNDGWDWDDGQADYAIFQVPAGSTDADNTSSLLDSGFYGDIASVNASENPSTIGSLGNVGQTYTVANGGLSINSGAGGQGPGGQYGSGGTWALTNVGPIAKDPRGDLTGDQYNMTWTVTKTVTLNVGDSIDIVTNPEYAVPRHTDSSGDLTAPVFLSATVTSAPVVTPSGSPNTFAVGGAGVYVDDAIDVASVDTNLSGATVTINNPQSGDTLNFVNQNGISGAYSDGVLTLTGSATVANYQTALQSVTFSTTSTTTTTRSISIVADDGALASDSAAESVNLAIGAPVVTPSDFQTLLSFNGTNGGFPNGSLTLSGSTLYGMTEDGGANGDGTIFSIPVTGGTPTTLASFNGTNGEYPYGSLTLSGSTLYGMTGGGGANGDGTIFSIPVTGGTPTTLLSFNGTNGEGPRGSLTLEWVDTLWDDRLRRGKRRRHHFQHSGDRRHSHDPALVQRHERRTSVGQFDAQWIDTLWDDGLRRGKRRRHDFQHSGDRRHSHDPALVQRHERRISRRRFDA